MPEVYIRLTKRVFVEPLPRLCIYCGCRTNNVEWVEVNVVSRNVRLRLPVCRDDDDLARRRGLALEWRIFGAAAARFSLVGLGVGLLIYLVMICRVPKYAYLPKVHGRFLDALEDLRDERKGRKRRGLTDEELADDPEILVTQLPSDPGIQPWIVGLVVGVPTVLVFGACAWMMAFTPPPPPTSTTSQQSVQQPIVQQTVQQPIVQQPEWRPPIRPKPPVEPPRPINRDNLLENRSQVVEIVCAADGKTLLCRTADAKVYEWNLKSREAQLVAEGFSPHSQVSAISPDGRYIAEQSAQDQFRLLDRKSGKRIDLGIPADGGRVPMRQLLFDGNSTRLVGENIRTGALLAWDVDRPEAQPQSTRINQFNSQLSRSGDGKWFVVANFQGEILLYASETLAPGPSFSVASVPELQGKRFTGFFLNNQGTWMAFSPTGDLLVTVFDEKFICLWDVKTRSKRALWQVDRHVVAITFSPDGKHLAGVGPTGKVFVWNVADGALVRELPHHELFGQGVHTSRPVRAIVYFPDGKTLATGVGPYIQLHPLADEMPK